MEILVEDGILEKSDFFEFLEKSDLCQPLLVCVKAGNASDHVGNSSHAHCEVLVRVTLGILDE